MKKYLLLILLTLTLRTFAQNGFVNDSVSLLPLYRQDVYYSLANRQVATDSSHNWDLAFATGVMSVGLHANHTNGITVYKTPFTVADFSTIDTSGYNKWDSLFNPYTSWDTGAFNTEPDQSVQFDYGWGYYNTNNNYVYGDRTFLIKINQNNTTSFKKLYVEYKYFNWVFRYANIDNTSDITDTVDVTQYPNKNFAYFNLTTNTFIDREPSTGSWDLLFTHYLANLGGGIYYPVTGVLTNYGVKSLKATGVDVINVKASSYDSSAYSSNISIIGWDWANFNMTTFKYDMVDSTVYFIKTAAGNIYKLLFNGFDYQQGLISFGISAQTTGITQVDNTKLLGMYPNPAGDWVNIITNMDNNKMELHVVNTLGQVIKTMSLDNMSGLKSTTVDMSNLNPGIYFISLWDGTNGYNAGKIIKE